jgi:hypothetical protein
MFRISPKNSQFGHALRNSFMVSNANRISKTVTSINLVKLCLHVRISGIQRKQKVQGVFPTPSSPFMRKRAMNVHMHS